MIAGMIALVAIGAGGRQMLANPGFDRGLAGWHLAVGANSAQATSVEGRSAASIIVSDDADVGFPCLYQETVVKPGELLEARVEAMGTNVRDGFGAYAAVGMKPEGLHSLRSRHVRCEADNRVDDLLRGSVADSQLAARSARKLGLEARHVG